MIKSQSEVEEELGYINMSRTFVRLAHRGQGSMVSHAIEVTEFNSKARCDLRGHSDLLLLLSILKQG